MVVTALIAAIATIGFDERLVLEELARAVEVVRVGRRRFLRVRDAVGHRDGVEARGLGRLRERHVERRVAHRDVGDELHLIATGTTGAPVPPVTGSGVAESRNVDAAVGRAVGGQLLEVPVLALRHAHLDQVQRVHRQRDRRPRSRRTRTSGCRWRPRRRRGRGTTRRSASDGPALIAAYPIRSPARNSDIAPVRTSTTSPGSTETPAAAHAASKSAPVSGVPDSSTSTPCQPGDVEQHAARTPATSRSPMPHRAAPASVIESAGWPFHRLPP